MSIGPVSNLSSYSPQAYSLENNSSYSENNGSPSPHLRNIHRNGSITPVKKKSIAYVFGEQVLKPLINFFKAIIFYSNPQPSPSHRCINSDPELAKQARINAVKRRLLSGMGIHSQEELDRRNEAAREHRKTKAFAQQMFAMWEANSNPQEKRRLIEALENTKSENPHARRILHKIRRIERQRISREFQTTTGSSNP